MVRKRIRDESHNHEAWAIPYADLLTLLLAFFVVMYSISSVNEGKYRVVSDALSQAFGGSPRATIDKVRVGTEIRLPGEPEAALVLLPQFRDGVQQKAHRQPVATAIATPSAAVAPDDPRQLDAIADALRGAMGDLIERGIVKIRRAGNTIEVELQTDILFPSGSSALSVSAGDTLGKIATILAAQPNQLRIEGHTDNVPIHNAIFPSNWELSAARAASVVHLFMDRGVSPQQMSVAGYAEFRPAADNATSEGRNRNRRVLVVVLGNHTGAAPAPPADSGKTRT
jgi:chemotaxis protein MotB